MCLKGDSDSLRNEDKLWIHQLSTDMKMPGLPIRVRIMPAVASSEMTSQVMIVMVMGCQVVPN